MIIEVKMYTIKCDNCGKEYESDEYSAFTTEDYAWDSAQEDDWTEDERMLDTHYCSECYYYNNDDKLIIKTK